MRGTDTVARIGGDEFVILFAPPLQLGEITIRRTRVIACMDTPIAISEDLTLALSLSVGMAIYPHQWSKH